MRLATLFLALSSFARPATAQLTQAIVEGDIVQLQLVDDRIISGEFVGTERGLVLIRTYGRDGMVERISTGSVHSASVHQRLEGEDKALPMAATFGAGTALVGTALIIGASDEPKFLGSDRDWAILITAIAVPTMTLTGLVLGALMDVHEWRPAHLPDDIVRRHNALRLELAHARAALAPPRPIGVSWSRSF